MRTEGQAAKEHRDVNAAAGDPRLRWYPQRGVPATGRNSPRCSTTSSAVISRRGPMSLVSGGSGSGPEQRD